MSPDKAISHLIYAQIRLNMHDLRWKVTRGEAEGENIFYSCSRQFYILINSIHLKLFLSAQSMCQASHGD